MIKIIVIRYRIIKITVIVIIQLIIQYLRHMLFGRGSGFSISCIFPFLQALPGNPLALPPGIPRSPDPVLSAGICVSPFPYSPFLFLHHGHIGNQALYSGSNEKITKPDMHPHSLNIRGCDLKRHQ